MTPRYEEAKVILKREFPEEDGFEVKIRSLEKEKKGVNRDLIIMHNGNRIAGIYVGKDFYNMSLDDKGMLSKTVNHYELKACNRMRCKFNTLDEVIHEIKSTML